MMTEETLAIPRAKFSVEETVWHCDLEANCFIIYRYYNPDGKKKGWYYRVDEDEFLVPEHSLKSIKSN